MTRTLAPTRQAVIDRCHDTPPELVSRARIRPEGEVSYLIYLTAKGEIHVLRYVPGT